MQKFTREELCRIGFVFSPGLRTQIDTAIPGVRPFPGPARGFETKDKRRPSVGAGMLARRLISALINGFGITRAFKTLDVCSDPLGTSTNSNSGDSFMEFPFSN